MNKNELIVKATEIGIQRAGSISKNDLVICLFIYRCALENFFFGDFDWYKQTISELLRLLENHGHKLSVVLPQIGKNKQSLLNFLFGQAYVNTTREQSDNNKSCFLWEYEMLSGSPLITQSQQPLFLSGNDTQITSISDKDLTCVVCYLNKRSILYSTCGHFVTCIQCTKQIGATCPVCRQTTTKFQKIYL